MSAFEPGTASAVVTAVDVRHVALPTGMKAVLLPNGHRIPTDLSVLVVRLTDGDQQVGYSLLWGQREPQLTLFEAAIRYLSPQLNGAHPDGLPHALARLDQAAAFVGRAGVAAFAASGLEMALQDLACRRAGVSLGRHLGQRADHLRAYQTGLMLPTGGDELVAEARAIYARGIKAIKMIVGKPSVEEDVARITQVRDALPADARLMVDALQRWDVPEALRAAEAFADLDLVWLEDPIDHLDLAGYEQLARESAVPIATGEALFSVDQFAHLLDVGVPFVIAELERVGGIGPWCRIADMAANSSSQMLSHIYPHVSAQLLSAGSRHPVWWEYVPWFDALIDYGFDIADGHVKVPDVVGSGFEPSIAAMDRYARTPWLSVDL
ncbi:mandelate racemase/muconate lactonizing enzyme family protein [Cryptosporangium sp. NPDC051539]|uniref:mandelate racemase/muconate lactonizing enzyme family protein n=1 Tax=Cryptosporangium sp. NPDC051539 TaxID=3363962 RepID=UPI003795BFE3